MGAQETANFAGSMAMVHYTVIRVMGLVVGLQRSLLANTAPASLLLSKGEVLG